MVLYIDGDALPNRLKSILLGTIERHTLVTYVISNKHITIGESQYITYIIVGSGTDAADDRIVEMLEEGDLVVTTDIPLADRVITKKAHAIDHRGKAFTETNIKDYLSMRNFMQDMRDCGIVTRGPAAFCQKDVHGFANQLNKFLTKYKLK